MGQESRSYIGLALVIARMYGILFCWIRPIQEEFDNKLMSASLVVTAFNFSLRIHMVCMPNREILPVQFGDISDESVRAMHG